MDLSNENVLHLKKGNIEYLQFRKLLEFEELNHAYILKPNNMNFKRHIYDSEEKQKQALEKYKEVCEELNFNYNRLSAPVQEHSANVVNVEKQEENIENTFNSYYHTDGLITNIKETPLVSTNADCILIIIYDPVNKVIANIHSGWRGTQQKIIQNGIKQMQQTYNTKPENAICCICPSIRKCHFEVDTDVKDIFYETFKYTGKTEEFIKIGRKVDEKQKYNIDTVFINKIMLEELGVKPENIVDSNICSVCNKDLIHSRRIEGENYNVSLAVIELKKQ